MSTARASQQVLAIVSPISAVSLLSRRKIKSGPIPILRDSHQSVFIVVIILLFLFVKFLGMVYITKVNKKSII